MRRREFNGLAAGGALVGMQGIASAGSMNRANLFSQIVKEPNVLPPDEEGYQTAWFEIEGTSEDGESCYLPYSFRVSSEGLEIEGEVDGELWVYGEDDFAFESDHLFLQESPDDEEMTAYSMVKPSELESLDGDVYEYAWFELDQPTADGRRQFSAFAYRLIEDGLEIEDDDGEHVWVYPEGLFSISESSICLADDPSSEYLTQYEISSVDDLDQENEDGFRQIWLEHDDEVCSDGRTAVYSYDVKFGEDSLTIRYDDEEEVYAFEEFDLSGKYLYLSVEGEDHLWGYRIFDECDLDVDVA